MYIGSWDDSDTITFSVLTKGANGAVADADAVPAYRIYEDETATPIHTGNMAKLDDANTLGLYSERIQIALVKGKSYSIYVSYAISAIAYGELHNIQMSAAADLRHVEGATTDGYNATLKLKTFMVVNDAGDAVYFQSQGGNGNGLYISGNGTAHGIFANGGINGGDGVFCYSPGSNGGYGLRCSGPSAGILGLGNDSNSPGIKGLGSGAGAGMELDGGVLSEAGFLCIAGTGSDGDGGKFVGDGDGSGVEMSNTDASGMALMLQDSSNGINAKLYLEDTIKNTEVISELSPGAPSNTPTLSQLLMFLYMQQKNKVTTTLTLQKLYASNGTTEICKNALDDNGTTFTRSPSVAP